MTKMNGLVASLCLLCFFGAIGLGQAEQPEPAALYGAESNPTGEPLGGGEGYSRLVLTGDHIVETGEQFLAALKKAKPGEVIYLPPQAEINLTGFENVEIPQGVTIAGNRGYEGSPGPLIYSNQLNTFPLLQVASPGVRFTGIRLRGPSPEVPDSIAMRIMTHHVEVDNCEVFNWSYAGIALLRANDVYIHHNVIHNVRRPGLGYPVVLDTSTALIEANIFDYYRHAIAGTGTKGTGYEARYNLVLEHAISHAFDMHGGTDYCPRKTCTEQDIYIAGDYVNIHHNTFLITSWESIRIRGVPREYVDIHHNWFIDPSISRSVRYRYYWGGNARVYQNIYGPEKRLIGESLTPNPFIFKEGSTAAVAPASITMMTYGFASPSATSTDTVAGVLPIELLPIVVDPSLGFTVDVSQVEIRLDGTTIYKEDTLPKPGELQLDTAQVADGPHELTVELQTNLDFPLRQSARFQVKNWWKIIDNQDAPSSSGWFGVIDFSRTSAMSSGWTYATDHPEFFGEDESRRVRLQSTEEYLVWETPRLRHVKAVVYSKTATPEGIEISVSAGQTEWHNLSLQVKASDPNDAGWYCLELSGSVPCTVSADWLRLVLSGGADPADIQIGSIEFDGLN